MGGIFEKERTRPLSLFWLLKHLITEDIGADLNDGFDTFIEKKGISFVN